MRSFLLLLIGIVIGAGVLGYGYLRLQEQQEHAFLTDTQSTIVTQLRSLARLTTSQMTISKVIQGQKDFSDFIPGFSRDDSIRKALFDDALLMTIEAKVNAGIDLSKITTGDIRLTTPPNKIKEAGESIIVYITLPKAEIFDVYLTDKTKPFERKLGILSKGNQELETKMRNDALLAVKQEAMEMKILETAQTNAESVIKTLLSKLGISQSAVHFQ